MNHLPQISQVPFGEAATGEAVSLFILRNSFGAEVKITNFGGIVTAINVADQDGQFADIVLGFDELESYVKDSSYFGALIGRVGNRIARGHFELDGEVYQLATNNGSNHLHGGFVGFDKVVWSPTVFSTDDSVGVKLFYLSADGDQGYPGNLRVTVTYTFTNQHELQVDYHATTDKSTPVNMTQHSYFNLAGQGDVLQHQLMINADYFTPIDKTQIPLGELRSVAGTPFDFRNPQKIGEQIDCEDLQLENGLGYDHNFVLNKAQSKGLSLAARVVEAGSGRVLEVYTEEPGVQFYSGNFLEGSVTGKGKTYVHRSGFCLEPQHFPDSPNQAVFPSIVLHPGEEYSSRSVFRFLTINNCSSTGSRITI